MWCACVCCKTFFGVYYYEDMLKSTKCSLFHCIFLAKLFSCFYLRIKVCFLSSTRVCTAAVPVVDLLSVLLLLRAVCELSHHYTTLLRHSLPIVNRVENCVPAPCYTQTCNCNHHHKHRHTFSLACCCVFLFIFYSNIILITIIIITDTTLTSSSIFSVFCFSKFHTINL